MTFLALKFDRFLLKGCEDRKLWAGKGVLLGNSLNG